MEILRVPPYLDTTINFTIPAGYPVATDFKMYLYDMADLSFSHNEFLNKGIINSIHDEITAKDIGIFYINHKGYKDRILSFVKPGDDSYKTLAKLLNKTPVVIPAAIGVGALQQKKKGGIVSELSNKEIKDLVAQGYIVEDVD